jgi:murein DD-endopeptidase MepM/ murein hydrolase activator NlpD
MKKLVRFVSAALIAAGAAAPMALAHAVPVALIHTPVPEPVMTSEYGMRTHPVTGKRSFHGAIDLRAARDQRVESVFDGVVKAAGPRGLLGNAVEVYHPKKSITTIYGHLNSVSVRKGQSIKMGETLGLAGSTGRSTGVHVHLIVKEGRKGRTLNPLTVLNDASIPHVVDRQSDADANFALIPSIPLPGELPQIAVRPLPFFEALISSVFGAK